MRISCWNNNLENSTFRIANLYPDISILFVTIHSAIQVFRPPLNERDHDGLDRYRYWIYATIALIPVLLSVLPFAMSNAAYQFSDAFCQLPARPIWYRLALAWIPRYAITLFVITVTIHMYVYVGIKFREFSASSDGSLAARRPSDVEAQQTELNNDLLSWPNALIGFKWTQHSTTALGRSTVQDSQLSQRAEERKSSDAQPLNLVAPSKRKSSIDEPRRASTITTSSKIQQDDDHRRSSSATTNSKFTNTTEKSGANLSTVKEQPVREQSITSSLPSGSQPNVLLETQLRSSLTEQVPTRIIAAQRVDLRRQLRNNFVYPIIYVATWTIPFIVTCMQFNPRHATNTPAWLGVLSLLSLTSMGAVDCLAFLWKEKPWRTESEASLSSGRRLSGCSTWWCRGSRRVSVVSGSSGSGQAEGGTGAGVECDTQRPIRPCIPRNRSGDRQKMARQRAFERLALEQQDRKEIASGEKLTASGNRPHKGRKEWWDVRRISYSMV